jgi:hypothetical protein
VKERAGIQAEAAAKEKVLQESDAERREIVPQLERGQHDTFERVLKARQGIAVAQAVDGHCSICHVRLRPQVFNTVLRNDSILQCDHCNRILYHVPIPASAATAPADPSPQAT